MVVGACTRTRRQNQVEALLDRRYNILHPRRSYLAMGEEVKGSLSLSPFHQPTQGWEERSSDEFAQGRARGSRSGRDFEAHHRGLRCMNLKAQETWDTHYRNDPGKYGLDVDVFLRNIKIF